MILKFVSTQSLVIIALLLICSPSVMAQKSGIAVTDDDFKTNDNTGDLTLDEVLSRYRSAMGCSSYHEVKRIGRSLFLETDTTLMLIREYCEVGKVCRQEIVDCCSASVALSFADGKRHTRVQEDETVLKQHLDPKEAFYTTDPLALFEMRMPVPVKQVVLLPYDSSDGFDFRVMFHLVDDDSVCYDISSINFRLDAVHFYPPIGGEDTTINFYDYRHIQGDINLPVRSFTDSRTVTMTWWLDAIFGKHLFNTSSLNKYFGETFFPERPITGSKVKYRRTYLIELPKPGEQQATNTF